MAKASFSQMPFHQLHRHQIAEPHVRDLVGDDVDRALLLGLGCWVGIDQQKNLAERRATLVFHRPEREVGDGDEVELGIGVGMPK